MSTNPKKAETMITKTMTTTVEAIVSFLEGQLTFFSSTLASRRNWTLLAHQES